MSTRITLVRDSTDHPISRVIVDDEAFVNMKAVASGVIELCADVLHNEITEWIVGAREAGMDKAADYIEKYALKAFVDCIRELKEHKT